jgi:heterodisulfide reductase subunit B
MSEEKYNENIKQFAHSNTEQYNILKVCEESTETQEKLLKYLTKSKEYKPKIEDIVEEIGDLELRLEFLKELWKIEKAVQERKVYKLKKLVKYREEGKYTGGN